MVVVCMDKQYISNSTSVEYGQLMYILTDDDGNEGWFIDEYEVKALSEIREKKIKDLLN